MHIHNAHKTCCSLRLKSVFWFVRHHAPYLAVCWQMYCLISNPGVYVYIIIFASFIAWLSQGEVGPYGSGYVQLALGAATIIVDWLSDEVIITSKGKGLLWIFGRRKMVWFSSPHLPKDSDLAGRLKLFRYAHSYSLFCTLDTVLMIKNVGNNLLIKLVWNGNVDPLKNDSLMD